NVAAGGACCAGGHVSGHEGSVQRVVGDEAAGKFVGRNAGGGGEFFAVAEGDEMIALGDDVARRTECGLQRVIASGAVEIVAHVVFAGPEEFHGRADGFGNVGAFD